MPQPLPAIMPPDFAPTLNAFRVGQQDKIAADKRNLMKEAGGLAAAGNMKGAMSKLYSGGEFDEARGISAELRAQSAEGRAAAAHARTLKNDELERMAKGQELIGRLTDTIQSPQQLEAAKAMIRARTGADLSHITMDQLPMLKAQGLSVQDALKLEMDKRAQDRAIYQDERDYKFREKEAIRAQGNTEMSFAQQAEANRRAEEQARLSQFNADRNYNAGRSDAAATAQYREDALKVQAERAKAAAAKANAPKPLTEGQAKARGYELELVQANENLVGSLVDRRGRSLQQRVLGGNKSNRLGEFGESPLSSTSDALAMNSYTPGIIKSNAFNKQEKQFLQSVEQFASVLLYHRSGAQISSDEFARVYRTYFPQPGDDFRTRRMKAEGRKNAIKGIRIQGGYDAPGAPETPSVSSMSNEDILKGLDLE